VTQAWDFVNANDLWQTRLSILDQSIDELELSIRAHHCLLNLGIKIIGELVTRTQDDLTRCPNFGRKSLYDVREALAMHRLSLAGEGNDRRRFD